MENVTEVAAPTMENGTIGTCIQNRPPKTGNYVTKFKAFHVKVVVSMVITSGGQMPIF